MKWIPIILIVGLLAPFSLNTHAEEKSSEWVKVKGMVCEVCAYGIRKSLMKEPEVQDVEVRIKEHKVKIVYKDPKKSLDRVKLAQILEDAG